MNIRIRKAEKRQWRELLALYKREGLVERYPSVTNNILNEFSEIGTKRVIWLAYDGEKVIGTVTLILNHEQKDLADGKTIAMVKRLRVDSKHMGKRVGSELNRLLEKEAKERSFMKLSIEVANNNNHARKIYEKWGYGFLRQGLREGEIAMIKDI